MELNVCWHSRSSSATMVATQVVALLDAKADLRATAVGCAKADVSKRLRIPP